MSFNVDIRVRLLDPFNASRHKLRDHEVARAFRAQNAESHHRRAIETGKRARFGNCVRDEPEVV
jgi:hypothetical protein